MFCFWHKKTGVCLCKLLLSYETASSALSTCSSLASRRLSRVISSSFFLTSVRSLAICSLMTSSGLRLIQLLRFWALPPVSAAGRGVGGVGGAVRLAPDSFVFGGIFPPCAWVIFVFGIFLPIPPASKRHLLAKRIEQAEQSLDHTLSDLDPFFENSFTDFGKLFPNFISYF